MIASTSLSPASPTATTHRDRHAALAGRAVAAPTAASAASSMSASGSTIMWFLAPPSAWTRLPCFVAGLVDVPRDRRRADEADRGDVRVLEHAVDRDLVPVDDVEDAVGQARLLEQLGHEVRADGSRSDGFSTNVLPQAIARAHPHRHHRREVERRDPGDDAERLADRVDVDPVETFSENPPLSRCGIPHANSITSSPRATSPCASESTLPCSSVRSAAISSRCSSSELAEREHDLRRCRERVRAPRGNAALAAATARSTSSTSAKSTSPVCSPVAGL